MVTVLHCHSLTVWSWDIPVPLMVCSDSQRELTLFFSCHSASSPFQHVGNIIFRLPHNLVTCLAHLPHVFGGTAFPLFLLDTYVPVSCRVVLVSIPDCKSGTGVSITVCVSFTCFACLQCALYSHCFYAYILVIGHLA
jgi:hypothetical protein